MAFIGIDLGTTNSLIAVLEDGVPRLLPNALGAVLTPSVVGVDARGTVTVGEAARAQLLVEPDRTAALFKRGMGTDRVWQLGRQMFRAEELSALILRSLREDAEAALGEPVGSAVISVPAYFNEVQRKAVRNAARIAGLEVSRLINEPTAAALAYGLQDRSGESTFLVYDLGGGTFDVSILEMFEGVMEVRATAGDAFLGGEDFTAALQAELARLFGLEAASLDPAATAVLREVAERAKLALTDRREVEVTAVLAGREHRAALTREAFESATAPLLLRLRTPVERALHDARLRPGNLDRVVLVGGATRMPLIRGAVSRQLQRFPETGLDPDHVVALGAAVQAGLVGRDAALGDVVMTDVSAFTLGIETAKSIGGRHLAGYFLPVIERNTTVPVSREEVVSTIAPGQRRIRVEVFQGEAPLVADNVPLGGFEVDVPNNPKDTEAIAVRFTYDVSGLLEVEARVLSTGHVKATVIRELAGDMPEADLRARISGMASLKTHPRDQAENRALQARIAQAYAMAGAGDRDWLQRMLAEFEDLLLRQDPDPIAAFRSGAAEALDRFERDYLR